MIILDAEDSQSKQFQDAYSGRVTLRFPDKAAARSESPLPDYETSEARQKLIAQASRHKDRSTKLWRAILYALIIYVILSAVIAVPIIVLKERKKQDVSVNFSPHPWDNNPATATTIGLSNSNDWVLSDSAKCGWDHIDANSSPFSAAYVEHTLNSSGSFNIRSNISVLATNSSFITGHLTVDLNPDSSATKAIFKVDGYASTRYLLDELKACFTDTGKDRGVFVFVSKELKGMDYISVNIRLLLPSKGPSLHSEDFITRLSGFSQDFGNLQSRLTITNFMIEGSLYDVVVESVQASKIAVKNSFASIIGQYHATSSLSLDSVKGDINANVTLENLSTATTPTSLLLDTGDGAINSQVTLLSPTHRPLSHNAPFPFIADVRTFNGPLSLHVRNANSTPPVPLQLNVQNTDGKTDVFLDKNFEGTYNVQSKLGKINLRKPPLPSSMDPLGQGRPRVYNIEQQSTNLVAGWVGWGNQPSGSIGVCQGQVRIVTSISQIMLHLAST